MKNKVKYVGIALTIVAIILLVGVAGFTSRTRTLEKKEFTVEFNQSKEFIDNANDLSISQIKIIKDFETKYLSSNHYKNTQFSNIFIPFLKSKMTDGLTSHDVTYMNKLVDVSSVFVVTSNDEIKTLRTKLIDETNIIKNATRYVHETSISSEPSKPYIGMTEVDLVECAWGQPEDVNKTTTAYGISKQYCYSGNKYVYVEDGIVTTIQD
ncbi:hypothetical protein [Clostridium sp.]|uniref:hypothetical protein n=1 Tax=Clostridium sp. TaxID=1506 RepID=UPI001A522A92|nr:hypothetical protein [Clostridium sp.]MBK5236666.1 hypothetical protein [Clostridium sp.]